MIHGRHLDVVGVAGVRGALDIMFEMTRPLSCPPCVLHGQDPAPGVSQEDEVTGPEAQGATDWIDLINEALEVPQRRITRIVTATRPQPIVVVVLDPRARQATVERVEAVVCRARATV